MAHHDGAKREDGDELGDAPVPWDVESASDHTSGAENAEDEGVLETLDETGKFLEEGGVLDFLCGGAPGHVDLEEVREDGL